MRSIQGRGLERYGIAEVIGKQEMDPLQGLFLFVKNTIRIMEHYIPKRRFFMNGTTKLIIVGVGAALLFSKFGPMGIVMMALVMFFIG